MDRRDPNSVGDALAEDGWDHSPFMDSTSLGYGLDRGLSAPPPSPCTPRGRAAADDAQCLATSLRSDVSCASAASLQRAALQAYMTELRSGAHPAAAAPPSPGVALLPFPNDISGDMSMSMAIPDSRDTLSQSALRATIVVPIDALLRVAPASPSAWSSVGSDATLPPAPDPASV